jgi:hypothetical protein
VLRSGPATHPGLAHAPAVTTAALSSQRPNSLRYEISPQGYAAPRRRDRPSCLNAPWPSTACEPRRSRTRRPACPASRTFDRKRCRLPNVACTGPATCPRRLGPGDLRRRRHPPPSPRVARRLGVVPQILGLPMALQPGPSVVSPISSPRRWARNNQPASGWRRLPLSPVRSPSPRRQRISQKCRYGSTQNTSPFGGVPRCGFSQIWPPLSSGTAGAGVSGLSPTPNCRSNRLPTVRHRTRRCLASGMSRWPRQSRWPRSAVAALITPRAAGYGPPHPRKRRKR